MKKLRLTPLALLLPCCLVNNLFASNDVANDNVEFDPAFLRGNENNTIDITRFQGKNSIAPGSYLEIDVYVNNEKKGTSDLIFRQDENDEVHLCLTEQLMDIFDLKNSSYQFDHAKLADVAQCINTEKAIKDSHVHFDLAKFRLDLTLPQALTNRRPVGYTSPKLWQNGIPALFVNYNLNYYRSFLSNASPISSLYLGVRGGLNYAGFSLVHTGSKAWQRTKSFTDVDKKYQSVETYLRKAVPTLKSEILIGDIGTSGHLLDGFSLRGIRLGSDDRVLPTSQQGYAPVVQGIAKSNALVTIKQGGYVISQVNVPAGPFLIDDLYPSASEGDLEVEITESNGEKRQFVVPFASLVQLVRPNQFKYQLAYGDFRYGSKVYHDRVFQGQLQYGLMNNLTLNSGLSLNKNYKAYLLGFGLNTKLGAFVLDGTYSDAKLNQDRFKGYSVRASYSVKVAPTDTFVTLATYRYSSRNFYTLTETVVTNNRTVNNTGSISLYNQITYRPKNQFQITLSQGFGDKLGRLYFQTSTKTFWRSKNKQRQLSLSYSNNIGNFNYHLGTSYSKELFGRKYAEFYLNISVPFATNHDLSASYYSAQNNRSLQADISGRLGQDTSYSLGVSSNQDKYRNINFNVGYGARYADININASADNQRNRQFSTNLSGQLFYTHMD
ncbi:fimbrial usher protein [Canicola haemoglobinophilus]|uniref:Fimbrial usher protein n=1 Tax=Canicola haemoglobinophilus TaxID=733 RepID=A0A377HT69_9PAST|nr:fimbria/pilus outer membrane usher protein [Canicola haemoglobinophilus]STO59119.1 fimbrial usher protein [Canicola haemoglobinophilus]